MKFKTADLIRRINDLSVDAGIANSQMNSYEINNEEFDDLYYNLLGLYDCCNELIEILQEQLVFLAKK